MTESLVPTVQTTPTLVDFSRALLAVLPEISKSAAAVLWAQFAVETGRGKHCYGWNLGNIKHVKGDGRDYHALKGVWEIINGKRVELSASDPGSWFRSFPSLAEGMKDHIEFLRGKRYAAVWPIVEQGDPEAFARALKARGYYTAPVEDYVRAIKPLHTEFMRSPAFDEALRSLASEPLPAPTGPVVNGQWVQVECNGVTWLVAPVYFAPVGIGEAVDLARKLGCELPSPELVDAIWRAADLRIDAMHMVRSHDGTPATMASEATFADQAKRLAAAIGERSLGVDFNLIAGAFKDVVIKDGKVGLYGWHRPDGSVIQPFYSGHARAWKDYSQGLRLVRRA